MIRVDVVDSMSIYVKGLEASLAPSGISVFSHTGGVNCSGNWRADVFLVNPDAVDGALLSEFVADLSSVAPVLLLIHEVSELAKDHCALTGACGLVRRSADAATVVSAVRSVVAGGEFWDSLGPALKVGTEVAEVPDSLSPRELQVLRQIARGLTHGQIATRLRISGNTVNTYVKRIRSKLRLGNKAELTRFAMRLSLLESDNN
jgi:DNA-binding NarL/FixJ family response regulator